jgi:hypothetical protein
MLAVRLLLSAEASGRVAALVQFGVVDGLGPFAELSSL